MMNLFIKTEFSTDSIAARIETQVGTLKKDFHVLFDRATHEGDQGWRVILKLVHIVNHSYGA